MDALRRDARALYLLVVHGFVGTALLGAIVGIAIAFGIWADEKGGMLFLLFALSAICGFVARASSRLDSLCEDCAVLGVPRHIESMRRAQWWLLTLFVLVPSLVGIACGTGVIACAVFIAAFALAIHLAAVVPVLIVLALGRNILEKIGLDMIALLLSTGGLLTLTVSGTVVLVRWFSRPAKLAAAARGGAAVLADAGHEEDPENAALALAAKQLDADMDALLPARVDARQISAARFWAGLGHDVSASWKACFGWLGLTAGTFTLLHFWKSGRGDLGVFAIACLLLVSPTLARFSTMHENWRATSGEQSLLLLAPLWPSRRELKWTWLRVVWGGVPQAATALLLFVTFVTLVGWVPAKIALCAIAALSCALCVMLSTFLSYFSYASLPKRPLVPIALMLLGFIGTGLIAFAWVIGTVPLMIGLALTLLPLALVLVIYALRPLQFPVRQRLGRGG